MTAQIPMPSTDRGRRRPGRDRRPPRPDDPPAPSGEQRDRSRQHGLRLDRRDDEPGCGGRSPSGAEARKTSSIATVTSSENEPWRRASASGGARASRDQQQHRSSRDQTRGDSRRAAATPARRAGRAGRRPRPDTRSRAGSRPDGTNGEHEVRRVVERVEAAPRTTRPPRSAAGRRPGPPGRRGSAPSPCGDDRPAGVEGGVVRAVGPGRTIRGPPTARGTAANTAAPATRPDPRRQTAGDHAPGMARAQPPGPRRRLERRRDRESATRSRRQDPADEEVLGQRAGRR